MQHTTAEIQYNQNGSANAGVEEKEDSTSMTVEYLRARLLSERSVTKATRERANELAKRVAELEEQLKIVSIQRKKAEKATLDVLALLENHGMGDISDDSDSDSGTEESFDTLKQKEESSGSEHESTPSIGRSLSWKSSRDSPRSCERKCFDPHKRNNFARSASSSRHRVGKSCRQIKRREVRSIVEESRHESRSPEVDGCASVDQSNHVTNGLHSRPEELKKNSQKNDDETSHNEQILVSSEAEPVSDGSLYLQKHTSDGEMKRALQHQAHLIKRFAAEEKAQREWEEKYMGNCSIQDTCEPGNQSDVTEERDVPEERAPSPPKNVASNTNSHKPESSIAHIDSFKFSSSPSMESSRKMKEAHPSRTSPSDFAFPVANETHIATSPRPSETKSNPKSKDYAIVPHQNPQKLTGVLDALQQAKLLLGRNISTRDTDIAKMAVGSAGLFRVPTDFQFQPTETSRPFSSTLDPFFSTMNAASEARNLSNKPWFGLPPTNGFTTPYSLNSTYPDMTRRISCSEPPPYIVQSPSRTPDLSPTGQRFMYNDHIRPGMYR